MWTETKFEVVRKETSTSRPFHDVVADLEAAAPVVRDRLDTLVTKDITPKDLESRWKTISDQAALHCL